MKQIGFLYFLSCLFLLSGCQEKDRFIIENPANRVGVIVSKEFIPEKNHEIKEVLTEHIGSSSKIYNLMAKTPEMYLIVLEVVEKEDNHNLRKMSYFLVTPSLFGDLQIGQSVSFEGNESVKEATIW